VVPGLQISSIAHTPNERMQAAEPSQMDGSLVRYQTLELYLRTIINQILPNYIRTSTLLLERRLVRKFRKG
jgi:hypothetical protein